MAAINTRQLRFEVMLTSKGLREYAQNIAKNDIFEPALSKLQSDFEIHDVTQEIDGGIDADNISDTLEGDFKSEDGRNLFSFIGFDDGSNPTEIIRELLRTPKLQYEKAITRQLRYEFSVSFPSLAALYRATPMPWASGLSWAEGIESGIPGVKQFLNTFKAKNSNSGGGVQVKSELRKRAKFNGRPYLSEMINEFVKNLR